MVVHGCGVAPCRVWRRAEEVQWGAVRRHGRTRHNCSIQILDWLDLRLRIVGPFIRLW